MVFFFSWLAKGMPFPCSFCCVVLSAALWKGPSSSGHDPLMRWQQPAKFCYTLMTPSKPFDLHLCELEAEGSQSALAESPPYKHSSEMFAVQAEYDDGNDDDHSSASSPSSTCVCMRACVHACARMLRTRQSAHCHTYHLSKSAGSRSILLCKQEAVVQSHNVQC